MCNRHEVVAQTQASSFLRINYFASQHQLARAFLANYEGKKNSCRRGKHPELNFRLSELGSLRGDDDVAGRHHLAASTECRSINHSDSRFRYLIQQTKDVVKSVEHLEDCVRRVIFDRNAGAEGPAVFVSFKNNGDQFTMRQFADSAGNLAHHSDVEDIQRWTRETYSSDAIVDSE